MIKNSILGALSGVLIFLVGCCCMPKDGDDGNGNGDEVAMTQKVEIGCATCLYAMEGVTGCQVALKTGGQAYLVVNSGIDAHEAGICESTKLAEVEGQIEDGKFVATSFQLSP